MPRIAHVISTPRGLGGAEVIMLALVDEGERRGWEQLVLNPFVREGEGTEMAERCRVPVVGRGATRLTDLPSLWFWLRRRLRSFRPDIVHAHLFHATVAVGSIPRHGEVRVLTHHHGDRLLSEGRLFEARLDRVLGRRFDRVVACSAWVGSFLLQSYSFPEERLTTIRNGWSGDPLPHVPSDPLTIACVASLTEKKGHRFLLEAMVSVLEQTDVRLVLIGDGPLRKELGSRARELGIDDHVDFRGHVSEIWPHLSEADLSVLSSTSEPLGIAALESMGAGLPIVATAVGGIPEIVIDGETGYLVPPRDSQAMAEAILRLAKDPELRNEMAAKAREHASGLRMEETVARYFQLYEDLLEDAR